MTERSPCPICGELRQSSERYPAMVCTRCAAKARDEQGRPIRFRSDSPLGGGFVAEVQEEDGLWHRVDEGACVIEGRRCLAREHRFGGIVVQLADAYE